MKLRRNSVILIVVLVVLLTSPAALLAAPIQHLPNFVQVQVCRVLGPGSLECGGLLKEELIAQPDAMLHIGFGSVFTKAYGGLSDSVGDVTKGDDFFVLSLEQVVSPYLLDSVSLVFGPAPYQKEYPIAIPTTAGLVFPPGWGPEDLSRLLGPPDGDYVAIESGAIVFEFDSSFIANAGPDQVVYSEVMLDGSGSYEPDGAIVSYQWKLQHRADSAYDRTAESINPTVSNLESGIYDVTLTVADDLGRTDRDTMLLAAAGECVQEPCDPCDPCEQSDATIRIGTLDITDEQGNPIDECSVSNKPVFTLNYTITERAKFPAKVRCLFRAFGITEVKTARHSDPGSYSLTTSIAPIGVPPGTVKVRALLSVKHMRKVNFRGEAVRDIIVVE